MRYRNWLIEDQCPQKAGTDEETEGASKLFPPFGAPDNRSDLSELARLWPAIPEPSRSGILTLARAMTKTIEC
jgi:hypothetical protein